MSRIGYYNINSFLDGPIDRLGPANEAFVKANFYFEQDISFLFPYINAVAKKSEFHEHPCLIRFVYKGVYCVLYPDRCIASPLDGHVQVRLFVAHLVAFLNEILEKKDDIIPKFKVFKQVAVTDIIKLLPITNCGDCGFKTCIAFAAMLSKQQTVPNLCPFIGRPMSEQVTYSVVDESGQLTASVTLHVDTMGPLSPGSTVLSLEGKSPQNQSTIETKLLMDTCLALPNLPDPLTPREIQVLVLMGEGKTNPEISDGLYISPHTVKSHVVHIFNKLGVNQRTQAVVWAVRHGII